MKDLNKYLEDLFTLYELRKEIEQYQALLENTKEVTT